MEFTQPTAPRTEGFSAASRKATAYPPHCPQQPLSGVGLCSGRILTGNQTESFQNPGPAAETPPGDSPPPKAAAALMATSWCHGTSLEGHWSLVILRPWDASWPRGVRVPGGQRWRKGSPDHTWGVESHQGATQVSMRWAWTPTVNSGQGSGLQGGAAARRRHLRGFAVPTLAVLPTGMRILVTLLLDTLPMLGNVLLLCFFVFFIFGIVGVQLWAGLLRNRCFLDSAFVR
ncbi:hypothetical protein P7K49_022684 [Saguinus oedipus]|uniref:Ion transport domain-containing protein n=1 Tax=Saguinus oedipus TaxID=9490 RepID=A0ABQ9UJJ1_SAGOE|nr:hypothetical protein P7K49_022684 [Saguinus oedipus]